MDSRESVYLHWNITVCLCVFKHYKTFYKIYQNHMTGKERLQAGHSWKSKRQLWPFGANPWGCLHKWKEERKDKQTTQQYPSISFRHFRVLSLQLLWVCAVRYPHANSHSPPALGEKISTWPTLHFFQSNTLSLTLFTVLQWSSIYLSTQEIVPSSRNIRRCTRNMWH